MEAKRGRPPKGQSKKESLDVRLDPSEKEAFRAAAELAGIPVSMWVRERLRRAAVRELEDAALPIAFLKRMA